MRRSWTANLAPELACLLPQTSTRPETRQKKKTMSVFTRNAAQPQLNTTNLRKRRIKYSDCLNCNKGVWNYYKHQGRQVCNMYDNNENCWQFNSENASWFQQMPLHNTVRKHSSKPDIVIGFRTIRTWEAWEDTVGILSFCAWQRGKTDMNRRS